MKQRSIDRMKKFEMSLAACLGTISWMMTPVYAEGMENTGFDDFGTFFLFGIFILFGIMLGLYFVRRQNALKGKQFSSQDLQACQSNVLMLYRPEYFQFQPELKNALIRMIIMRSAEYIGENSKKEQIKRQQILEMCKQAENSQQLQNLQKSIQTAQIHIAADLVYLQQFQSYEFAVSWLKHWEEKRFRSYLADEIQKEYQKQYEVERCSQEEKNQINSSAKWLIKMFEINMQREEEAFFRQYKEDRTKIWDRYWQKEKAIRKHTVYRDLRWLFEE